MIPPPAATGLFLCQRVDFNSTTRMVSLIDVFWRLELPALPATAPPFIAFAALRGGHGSGRVQLAAYRLDRDEVIYATGRPITFTDRRTTVYVPIRVAHCRFPVAGDYAFSLLVDRDIVAQQSLHVALGGSQP